IVAAVAALATAVLPHHDKATIGERRDRRRELKALRGAVDQDLAAKLLSVRAEHLRSYGAVAIIGAGLAAGFPADHEAAIRQRRDRCSLLRPVRRRIDQEFATGLVAIGAEHLRLDR